MSRERILLQTKENKYSVHPPALFCKNVWKAKRSRCRRIHDITHNFSRKSANTANMGIYSYLNWSGIHLRLSSCILRKTGSDIQLTDSRSDWDRSQRSRATQFRQWVGCDIHGDPVTQVTESTWFLLGMRANTVPSLLTVASAVQGLWDSMCWLRSDVCMCV